MCKPSLLTSILVYHCINLRYGSDTNHYVNYLAAKNEVMLDARISCCAEVALRDGEDRDTLLIVDQHHAIL